MAKALRVTRSAAVFRALGVALLATVLLLGLTAPPASAGAPENCCICSTCIAGPLNICFEGAPGGCANSCATLNCFTSQDLPGFCSTQPGCSQFAPPAAAPAMAPYGLGIAAVVLTGFGLRGLRRRR